MSQELPGFEIRRAAPLDAQLLSVLATTCFYEAYFEQDAPHNLASYIGESFAEDKIAAEIDLDTVAYFIMFRNQRAVGFAIMRSDTKFEGIDDVAAIELQRIYVIERVYGAGAGELLLRHCEQFARGLGLETIWLGVWEENLRAQRFYAKHGYSRIGQIEFPYGDVVGTNHVLVKSL